MYGDGEVTRVGQLFDPHHNPPLLALFELDHPAHLHVLPLEDGDGPVLAVVVHLLDLHPELETAHQVGPASQAVVAPEVDVETNPAEVGVGDGISLSYGLHTYRGSDWAGHGKAIVQCCFRFFAATSKNE